MTYEQAGHLIRTDLTELVMLKISIVIDKGKKGN